MNKTTELLYTKTYPAIYERAEQIFPELNFRKQQEDIFPLLIDYSRSPISIWNYIKQTLKWVRWLSLMYEQGNNPHGTINKDEYFS